jgi:hypothetical protein
MHCGRNEVAVPIEFKNRRSLGNKMPGSAQSGAVDRKPPVRFGFATQGRFVNPAAARPTHRERFDTVAVKSVNTQALKF